MSRLYFSHSMLSSLCSFSYKWDSLGMSKASVTWPCPPAPGREGPWTPSGFSAWSQKERIGLEGGWSSGSVVSDSLWPQGLNAACTAPLSMDFSGKNTGVGCHFLLQRIFATLGSSLHLLRWQAYSLPLCPQGSPQGRLLLLLLSRFSCVRLCATPWTAAYQAPPSLGFQGRLGLDFNSGSSTF